MRTYRTIPDLTTRQLRNFWAKVAVPNQPSCCWEWSGKRVNGRYPYFGIYPAGEFTAYRVAYTLLIGPIPEGMTLDHLCRNPGCVNPDHLEPVPPGINVLRGYGIYAQNARKTRCVHGHEFTPQNTKTDDLGYRRCRACAIEYKEPFNQEYQERYSAVSQCCHGHAYTPENTYVTRVGRKRCRICHRAGCARYKHDRRDKARNRY